MEEEERGIAKKIAGILGKDVTLVRIVPRKRAMSKYPGGVERALESIAQFKQRPYYISPRGADTLTPVEFFLFADTVATVYIRFIMLPMEQHLRKQYTKSLGARNMRPKVSYEEARCLWAYDSPFDTMFKKGADLSRTLRTAILPTKHVGDPTYCGMGDIKHASVVAKFDVLMKAFREIHAQILAGDERWRAEFYQHLYVFVVYPPIFRCYMFFDMPSAITARHMCRFARSIARTICLNTPKHKRTEYQGMPCRLFSRINFDE